MKVSRPSLFVSAHEVGTSGFHKKKKKQTGGTKTRNEQHTKHTWPPEASLGISYHGRDIECIPTSTSSFLHGGRR